MGKKNSVVIKWVPWQKLGMTTGDEVKRKLYDEVALRLAGLLAGETDLTVKMASIVAVLHGAFSQFFWTGFYRYLDDELVIGPYQGTPACLRIKMGKGVCGTAALSREIQVVDDVHAFPGHIACDARSNSEIVLPVIDREGNLLGVLDIDSTDYGSFDGTDAEELEKLLTTYF